MIGGFLGLSGALGMIAGAWSGTLEPWGFGVFLIAGLVGIFLMPMTVGIFMTIMMSASPIAVLAGIISGQGSSALTAAGIGLGAFVTQWIVGAVRGVN